MVSELSAKGYSEEEVEDFFSDSDWTNDGKLMFEELEYALLYSPYWI